MQLASSHAIAINIDSHQLLYKYKVQRFENKQTFCLFVANYIASQLIDILQNHVNDYIVS